MRTIKLLAFLVSIVTAFLAGCSGENKPEYGDKKQDWAPSKPPEGWRGPGQPGAPTVPNPAATPPSGK